MKAIAIIKNQFTVDFTIEELSVLCNALKVVCTEIEEWEFQTRLGIHLKDAKILLEKLTSILQKIQDGNECEAQVAETHREFFENIEFTDSSMNEFAQIGDDEWLICPVCIDPWISRDSLSFLVKCPKCLTILRNPRHIDSR